jgi:riboflavin kinase/FMN adenylyltransferase
MFDGVHRGHQFVLRHVVETARRRGLPSMAITFDKLKTTAAKTMLTPLDEKLLLLSRMGIDRTEVLPFTDALRQMTARQFMQQVLKEQLHVQVLLTGYDNRFGYNREEGYDDYVRYGHELGIEVQQLPQAPDGNVSSSIIRQLLTEGRVTEAAQLLGYPYTVMGRVAHGEHIGTSLGFPTANIVPDSDQQLIPANGVYAVKVQLDNSQEQKHAMMNIGHRPTFDGQQQTMEAHIFQLSQDLYDQHLSVSFIGRLRDERRFDSKEALKEQLRDDAIQTEELFKQENVIL